MNRRDMKRLNEIHDMANKLMNAGDTGSGIRNAEVIEAIMEDVERMGRSQDPKALPELIERDKKNHTCHYAIELRLSDCNHGCKVYQCRFFDCTNEFLMHSTTYGCTKG